MKTKLYDTSDKSIKECARILRAGGLVAIPTETVYGLGANALDEKAVAKVFEAKGRPADNPLIVHIADFWQAEDLAADIPPVARVLVGAFTPGPLTLVLPKNPSVPDIVTAGHSTVAVRIPSNDTALRLLAECNFPICAPSANLSGRPSPTTAAHVLEDLDGRIDAVIDGGACAVGVESTVIDVTTSPPRILRSGGVSAEDLRRVIGEVEEYSGDSGIALAPGMKYRHYAPKCDMYYAAYSTRMHNKINAFYDGLTKTKKPVILCTDANAARYGTRDVITVGKAAKDYARNVYAALRAAEKSYGAIIAEGVEDSGIGRSIINRLIKASGGKLV